MEGVKALGAALACAFGACAVLTGCLIPQPIACPAIAAAPVVTIHVTPERAATLDPASFTGQACQDGQCHGGQLSLSDDSGTNSRPGGKRAQIMMMTLTESPIDLTVSGTNTSGWSIGTSRVRFTPRVEYPFGRQCPQVLIAEATLDNQGLYAD